MDTGFRLKQDNQKKKANILSKLFFTWMVGLLYKGAQKGLEVTDLYKLLDCDKSANLGDKLGKNWETEVAKAKLKKSKPSLMRALIKTFLPNYMIYGALLFLQVVVLRSVQPIVFSYLIQSFSPDEAPENPDLMIWVFGGVLILISILVIFLLRHTIFGQSVVGMRVRIAVSSLVYRKITRLNQKSLGQTTAGQVVNLLSNDVSRFDMVAIYLHFLWIIPFQLGLVTYFIWREVGISTLTGVVTMAVLSLPGQGYLGKLIGNLRLKVANKTDHRVKLMSEIISGIQVIKMYAWEKPFEKIIRHARSTEIDDLTKTSYLRGIFTSGLLFIEKATVCLTVICYVLLGNNITASKVFSMAQFFNILQLTMAINYPLAISTGAEALVSVKRLQAFLVMEEKEASTLQSHNEKEIQITNMFASWVAHIPILKEINLNILPGTLCAIVGPVGAGKSSLLQVLLGELPPTTGGFCLGGEISYSSQEPWLFSSSARSNILFGQTYNKLHYHRVVEVCALEKDFEQFSQGDSTVVGERGVSLSGGQRARINLARAIYRQADVYLLDDPLSAVDTHVGKHIFEECIIKHLRGKTRILVTHQLQYLKKADMIVVLNEGKIEAQGTFSELTNSNLNFTKILVAANESVEKPVEKEIKFDLVATRPRRLSVLSIASSVMSDTIENMHANVENEEKLGGESNISPFYEYFKATGHISVITLIILFIIAQAAYTGADYWVAFWTAQEEIRNSNNITILTESLQNSTGGTLEIFSVNGTMFDLSYYTYNKEINNTYSSKLIYDDIHDTVLVNDVTYYLLKTNIAMYIYGSLIIIAIFFTLARSLLFFKIAMMASKSLHSKMFHCLLKAPMQFFDTNISGRILNRFSKDMGAVDEILPKALLEAIQITLFTCGVLVNIGVSNPYIIIAVVILGVVFLKISLWFVSTVKNISHLEGITKSPVFSHVSSSLNGITTIRASKAEEILISEFDGHQDVHTSAWYLTLTCVASFGLWLDIICVIFIACVTFSFIIMHKDSTPGGSWVGLAIWQSLALTGVLQFGVRQITESISQLTSVERVLEYTTIENEGPFETSKENFPAIPWPSLGLTEFRNLFLIHVKDGPPVLKNLNFTIRPGEKIGIVGRTGAGKSSLISALFRLVPLEGNIFIDGVDTNKLGLTDLRKRISIIPQEPVLFSATVRYNLDPFNEFEDSKLWKALEEVELKDAVTSLDLMVSEGGGNFSLGQRQLICLARAVVRNNRILVMDEITANVDHRTDALIQKTIRRKFVDCTVLTIAHRLNTIMDSDKVLVMDSGSMVEFDHPHTLLQIPDGFFHKMVLQTGPTMSLQLKDIALETFNQKENVIIETHI